MQPQQPSDHGPHTFPGAGDTARFPTYGYAVQGAEGTPPAGGPQHHDPFGGPGHAGPVTGAAPAPARRRLGLGAKLGIGALVLLLVAAVALVGLELGMRKSLTDRVEKEASASLGGPAKVELGGGPVLLSALTGTLGSVHITSDAADPATSPSVDLTGTDVRSEGDATHMGSLNGTVSVSDQYMTRAAREKQASGGQAAENPLLGGLTQVQSITADPGSGTLKASIGGLLDVDVVPRVDGGTLRLEPQSASFLGFDIPSSVLGGAASMMDQTLTDLPEGVEVTGVKVVEGGMSLELAGKDVTLRQK